MNPQTTPAADPLAQLRDIHLPDPVSAWPPAPGWWIVAIIGLIAIGFMVLKYIQHRRQRRYRQLAYADLRVINQHDDQQVFLQQLNQLLKQVALTAYSSDNYPALNIEAMHGEKWLAFLEQSSKHRGFIQGPGQVLAEGPYRAQQTDIDKNALTMLAEHWINDHYKTLAENKVAATC